MRWKAIGSMVGLTLLSAATLAGAQTASTNNLDSGGGVRGTETIRVRDSLGSPLIGRAEASTAVAQSGIIPGLPAATPIELRFFSLSAEPGGITLEWYGNDDLNVMVFRIERGVTTTGERPRQWKRLDPIFDGTGPHTFTDTDLVQGRTYFYRLKMINRSGKGTELGPWSIKAEADFGSFPTKIMRVSPNPFQGATAIQLTLEEPSSVRWLLLTINGRRIAGGRTQELSPGYHSVTVRPQHPIAAGVYFLYIQAGEYRDIQKLVNLP